MSQEESSEFSFSIEVIDNQDCALMKLLQAWSTITTDPTKPTTDMCRFCGKEIIIDPNNPTEYDTVNVVDAETQEPDPLFPFEMYCCLDCFEELHKQGMMATANE